MRLGRRLAVGVAVEKVQDEREHSEPVIPSEPAEVVAGTGHLLDRAEALAGQPTER